jgi:acyl-coenzyme A synthetase/AMP-(fatty) acid ligase
VPKQGIEPSKDLGSTLLKFVKEKKVRYKWIVEIEFTDVVPKSPTGKLLRRVLKAKDREKDRVRGVWIRDEAERARL